MTEKYQGYHSYFRPRKLSSQTDDYLCLFQRTEQPQRVTGVTSPLGPCPWYGSLAIDNTVGSTPQDMVMVLPLWQGQKAEDQAKGDYSQVLIINVVCLIYWVLDLLGAHYPFPLLQVFLLGWICIPYTCPSVVWKLVTFLLHRFTAGEKFVLGWIILIQWISLIPDIDDI